MRKNALIYELQRKRSEKMTNFYLKRQGARIRDNRFKRSNCAHLFLGKKERYLSSQFSFLYPSHAPTKKTANNNPLF